MNEKTKPTESQEKPGFIDIVKSTLAGAVGVQSTSNRERDFKHGSIKTFAIAGIIFTVLFIGAVVGVVKLVLSQLG